MIITGTTTLFLEPNTDTDVIIPARFLKRTSLEGFEPFAFYEKRYDSSTKCQPSIAEKDFVFEKKIENDQCSINHPHSRKATFLITWFNFGCGSSREHAVYALQNYRVIIGSAPTGKTAFADIFRDNCRQNLIRTPVITETEHQTLVSYVESNLKQDSVTLKLDTENKKILADDGKIYFDYELPDHHEAYISKGLSPFEMAKKEILNDLKEIDHWNQQHQKTLAHYPTTQIN